MAGGQSKSCGWPGQVAGSDSSAKLTLGCAPGGTRGHFCTLHVHFTYALPRGLHPPDSREVSRDFTPSRGGNLSTSFLNLHTDWNAHYVLIAVHRRSQSPPLTTSTQGSDSHLSRNPHMDTGIGETSMRPALQLPTLFTHCPLCFPFHLFLIFKA